MGEIIKARRELLKMTQHQLAERMNVTQGAIQQWESGKSNPRQDKLLKLAKILEIRVDELLKGA